MPHNPILSPAHHDNDVLILEGVLHGVYEQGAQYGLSHPRRELLALTLNRLVCSLREGWEEEFKALLYTLQTGRPSQPVSERRGDHHLSDTSPKLPRRTGTD